MNWLSMHEIIGIGCFAGWGLAIAINAFGYPKRCKFAFWFGFFACFASL